MTNSHLSHLETGLIRFRLWLQTWPPNKQKQGTVTVPQDLNHKSQREVGSIDVCETPCWIKHLCHTFLWELVCLSCTCAWTHRQNETNVYVIFSHTLGHCHWPGLWNLDRWISQIPLNDHDLAFTSSVSYTLTLYRSFTFFIQPQAEKMVKKQCSAHLVS